MKTLLKTASMVFGVMLVVGLVAVWLLVAFYPDPKEPNRNNWTKKVDIPIVQENVVGDAFQYAENYVENAKLCYAEYLMYPHASKTHHMYGFYVPANGNLPNGVLIIQVNTQEKKIVSVEMDYDRSGDFEKAMDEAEAREVQERVVSFYQNQKWNDDDIDSIRFTWLRDRIYAYAWNQENLYLWEKSFVYSDNGYVEVPLQD